MDSYTICENNYNEFTFENILNIQNTENDKHECQNISFEELQNKIRQISLENEKDDIVYLNFSIIQKDTYFVFILQNKEYILTNEMKERLMNFLDALYLLKYRCYKSI